MCYTLAVSDARVHDVIVVGAGPAGAAVAARLHQHGVRDVVVLDRYDFPRDKPCGGGLTGHIDEALAALDLALTVPAVAAPAATVRFGAFQRTVTLGRPVQVIRRIEFDASLVAQVRARGVEVRTGVTVDELAVADDRVRLRLGGGGGARVRRGGAGGGHQLVGVHERPVVGVDRERLVRQRQIEVGDVGVDQPACHQGHGQRSDEERAHHG